MASKKKNKIPYPVTYSTDDIWADRARAEEAWKTAKAAWKADKKAAKNR